MRFYTLLSYETPYSDLFLDCSKCFFSNIIWWDIELKDSVSQGLNVILELPLVYLLHGVVVCNKNHSRPNEDRSMFFVKCNII